MTIVHCVGPPRWQQKEKVWGTCLLLYRFFFQVLHSVAWRHSTEQKKVRLRTVGNVLWCVFISRLTGFFFRKTVSAYFSCDTFWSWFWAARKNTATKVLALGNSRRYQKKKRNEKELRKHERPAKATLSRYSFFIVIFPASVSCSFSSFCLVTLRIEVHVLFCL